jgi:hypothetical protein
MTHAAGCYAANGENAVSGGALRALHRIARQLADRQRRPSREHHHLNSRLALARRFRKLLTHRAGALQ